MADPPGDQQAILSEQALSAAPLAAVDHIVEGIRETEGPVGPMRPLPSASAEMTPSAVDWRVLPRGNWSAPAVYGEQNMVFIGYRQEEGWHLLDGPSGAAGHPYNSPGFDGVVFRVDEQGGLDLRIVDNKALKAAKVPSATAITTNLHPNLDRLDAHVRGTWFDDVPHIAQVRDAISNARSRLASGLALPPDVTLEITNVGGLSVDIAQALKDQGIRFRNLQAIPPAPAGPVPPGTEAVAAATPPPVDHGPASPRALRGPPAVSPELPRIMAPDLSRQRLSALAAVDAETRRIASFSNRIQTSMRMAGGLLEGLEVLGTVDDVMKMASQGTVLGDEQKVAEQVEQQAEEIRAWAAGVYERTPLLATLGEVHAAYTAGDATTLGELGTGLGRFAWQTRGHQIALEERGRDLDARSRAAHVLSDTFWKLAHVPQGMGTAGQASALAMSQSLQKLSGTLRRASKGYLEAAQTLGMISGTLQPLAERASRGPGRIAQ